MHYIYVLQSQKMAIFIQATQIIFKKISEHNSGKVFSTRNRIPFRLIYFEGCSNIKDAYAREKYLKSGMVKRYIRID